LYFFYEKKDFDILYFFFEMCEMCVKKILISCISFSKCVLVNPFTLTGTQKNLISVFPLEIPAREKEKKTYEIAKFGWLYSCCTRLQQNLRGLCELQSWRQFSDFFDGQPLTNRKKRDFAW